MQDRGAGYRFTMRIRSLHIVVNKCTLARLSDLVGQFPFPRSRPLRWTFSGRINDIVRDRSAAAAKGIP